MYVVCEVYKDNTRDFSRFKTLEEAKTYFKERLQKDFITEVFVTKIVKENI